MTQSELTELVLKWGLISICVGALTGACLGTILLIRQSFIPKFRSVVVPEDFLGHIAVVILPLGISQIGKVRITLNGQNFERRARSDEDAAFNTGDLVLVTDIDERGIWVITTLSKEFTFMEAL